METIDSLIKSLIGFKGGVLLISHDERLISLVCDTIWYFKDKSINVFQGEFSEYRQLLLQESLQLTNNQ